MQSRYHQRGMSIWQLGYVLFSLGVFGIVGMKSFPIFADEAKLSRAVQQCAAAGNSDAYTIDRDLQRRWAIEDITNQEPKQIKLKRVAAGLALAYDYQKGVDLFGNASLVFHFTGEHLVNSAGGP